MSNFFYCNYTITEAYKNNKLTQNTKKDWGSHFYQVFKTSQVLVLWCVFVPFSGWLQASSGPRFPKASLA